MSKDYLLPLREMDNPDIAGVKGKNLHRLLKNRFPVPETFCLTTGAYEDFQPLIQRGEFPQEIETEIRGHPVLNRPGSRWAVRSSSVLEDLPQTSFAGLYDSFLDVSGADAIVDAVKKCWASLWNQRAVEYRRKNRLLAEPLMAVLIQEMVDALYSGVVFTGSPENRNAPMVFEYCRGRGDKLVSGLETPVHVEIDRKSRTVLTNQNSHRAGAQWEPDEERLRELADLALAVEKFFGSPRDIEWAFDGGSFFILQSRPVSEYHLPTEPAETFETGAGSGGGLEWGRVWTRANIGEVLPGVVTPLTWEVFRAVLSGNPGMLAAGAGEESIAGLKRIQGRVYIRLKEFLDSFCYLPFVTPEVMNRVLGVETPVIREKYRPPRGVVVRLAQVVFLMDVVGIFRRISRLVEALPPLPTGAELGELVDWVCLCFRLHLKCTAYAVGVYAYVVRFLEPRFPQEVEELLPVILTGHEHLQTASQGVKLHEIANKSFAASMLSNLNTKSFWESRTGMLPAPFARPWDFPSLQAVSQSLIGCTRRVPVGGDEFSDMFREFMEFNGARAAGEFELAVPRWREDPSFVLEMITKFKEVPLGERHGRREEYVRRIRSRLGVVDRKVFDRVLRSYSDFTTYRENLKYRLMEGFALLRGYFLERGEVLSKAGKIASRDDIFFLKPFEIALLMAGGGADGLPSPAGLVATRRKEQAVWERHHPPALYVDGAVEPGPSVSSSLTGIGCSPGVVEGVARVLFDLSETAALRADEILVTPHTDPGWTPLFLVCKGLVTEIGGFLSHGATVAREYGLPAVVNVAGAASSICSGDLIRVDGTRGRVIILAKNKKNTAENAEGAEIRDESIEKQ